MNILIWLIAGAIVGWVATSLMHDRSNLLINIIVGIVGAFVAGYLLSPILHISTINQGNFSLEALLVSLGGAVILLAILNLFFHRRGFITR
jgi:uncharacterized membrane protein YeaQ/YmgE (transglycosylase-associated protein family)